MKTELLLLALMVLFSAFYVSNFTGMIISVPTTHATRIIDGDTIEIADGERVRLLGIDTPEKGQHLFEEAKQRLTEIIGGKEIVLEKDVTDKDKYDRLLRNVFINRGDFVNIMLVREGLAEVLIIPPDSMYEEELLKAEAEARNQGAGIWAYQGISDVYCIGIFYFRFNAAGDDRENLNGEYVEFRNKCTYPVDMTGWKVSDAYGHEYVFPEFIAQNKTKFRLLTGSGRDSGTALHWDSRTAIWNNAGDTMQMTNQEGDLILEYTYEGY